MTLVTKNLGLVKALQVSITAPSNTTMIWYDDNVGQKVPKYFDTNTSIWTSLKAGDGLPSQVGNANKILVTDGTNASWTSSVLALDNSLSLDYFSRLLFNSSSVPVIHWETEELISTVGNNVAVDWGLRQLVTSTVGLSVDWEAYGLYGTEGNLGIDFGNRELFRSDGTSRVMNWQFTRLYDDAGTQSIDWGNRLLKNNSGIVVLDWIDGLLYNGSHVATVAWSDRQMYDQNLFLSIDWGFYLLGDSNNITSSNWDLRRLYDLSSNVSIDWEIKTLKDDNGLLTVNWNNRQLINSSGTVMLDWENGTLPGFSVSGLPSQVGNANKVLTTNGTIASWNFILRDNGGLTSINYDTRLISDGSQISINYSTRELIATTTNTTIDWNNGTMSDPGTADLTLDWSAKQLLSLGFLTIDWGARHLASAGVTTLNWVDRWLVDSTGNTTVDWESCQLITADGFTQTVDWTNAILTDTTGAPSADWDNRYLYDNATGVISVSWNTRALLDENAITALSWFSGNRYLLDSTASPTVDWDAGILLDNSGTIARLNWLGGDNLSMTFGTSSQNGYLGGSFLFQGVDINNSGATDTTLFSNAINADAIVADNSNFTAEYSVSIASSATATRKVSVLFCNTVIYNSTAIVFPAAATLSIKVIIYRDTSTSFKYLITVVGSTGAALANDVQQGRVTSGVDWTVTNNIVLKGQAAGTGSGSNQITARFGKGEIYSI